MCVTTFNMIAHKGKRSAYGAEVCGCAGRMCVHDRCLWSLSIQVAVGIVNVLIYLVQFSQDGMWHADYVIRPSS